ncbi:hypothetical protein C0J52_26339, partial [Blattella germanica]
MILVKMRDFEEKLEVLRNKNKLRGIECYIDNDMTKEERSIQAALRRRAKEEAEKGHTVRAKRDNAKKTGTGGGKSKQPEEVDEAIYDILERYSVVLDGLNLPE